MDMIIKVTLKEGCYSTDHKTVDIKNQLDDVIAKDVPTDYAKLIIKAVNENI